MQYKNNKDLSFLKKPIKKQDIPNKKKSERELSEHIELKKKKHGVKIQKISI
jgi:glycogen synthase